MSRADGYLTHLRVASVNRTGNGGGFEPAAGRRDSLFTNNRAPAQRVQTNMNAALTSFERRFPACDFLFAALPRRVTMP